MSGKIKRLFLVLLLIPFWIFLRSVYRDRIGAFGCFDDCFNIMGGFFLLQGKHLFSEIFFNHMPLMAHISAAIQHGTNPTSIYMLMYEHRMMLIYFFIVSDVLLVLRFGIVGFGFALLYESTKGFLFGERFLAESIIVYPLVYLFGLVMERKPLRKIEILFITFLVWFVIFMREPYIPLVLWLFGSIIWHNKKSIWAVFLLLVGTVITVMYYGAQNFIFNVFMVNTMTITKEVSLWTIVFYPVLLFGGGVWNLIRQIEVVLVLMLVTMRKRLLIICIVLLLANLRSVSPGSAYYAAFHHIVWYGLLIFAAAQISSHKTLSKILFGVIIIFAIVSPQSYLHERVDRQTEFVTNYNSYFVTGEVVRLLSDPGDTLFLDGQDDLIYWQAKQYSPYKFSWYTSLMPFFPVYTKAREEMFKSNPPTFYYGNCTNQGDPLKGRPLEANLYIQLSPDGQSNCLFVRRDKISLITDSQWGSVAKYNYYPVDARALTKQ